MTNDSNRMRRQRNVAREQRDELLAAIKPLAKLFERLGGEHPATEVTFKVSEVAPLYVAARKAIYRVEHDK